MKIFNVRVYGVLVSEQQGVLVSDEYILGKYYTKFPGGGLEMGEGTRDCLKREFMEEMGQQIEVGNHLYTTDFYQESAFKKGEQIISIYYYVEVIGEIKFPLTHQKFDFTKEQLKAYKKESKIETFRFIPLADFSPGEVSFPIDKIVGEMILKK